MKSSVRSETHALNWERASSKGSRHGPGGRARGLAVLYEWMFPLAGLLFLADAFSLIKLWPPIEYLLAGMLLGAFAGKSVVVWRERGDGELHPDRVRRIEYSWTVVGASLMVLAVLVQVALA